MLIGLLLQEAAVPAATQAAPPRAPLAQTAQRVYNSGHIIFASTQTTATTLASDAASEASVVAQETRVW